MLDLLLSVWIHALAATTLLFALVVGAQTTLRWMRRRRPSVRRASVPSEPLTTSTTERISA